MSRRLAPSDLRSLVVVRCDGADHRVVRLNDGRIVALDHEREMFRLDTAARIMSGLKLEGCAAALLEGVKQPRSALFWGGPRAALKDSVSRMRRQDDPLLVPLAERAVERVGAMVTKLIDSTAWRYRGLGIKIVKSKYASRADWPLVVEYRRDTVLLPIHLSKWCALNRNGLTVTDGLLVIDRVAADDSTRVLALRLKAKGLVLWAGTTKYAAVSHRTRIVWDSNVKSAEEWAHAIRRAKK